MKPSESAVWIPLTIQTADEELLFIERADREFLYDDKGNQFIDGIASWWTSIHGHCHPQIIGAITEQINKLDHVMLAGFIHAPAENLALKIIEIAGGEYKKVFYSDNGSNAVEIAIKIAVQYFKNKDKESKKEKFIIFSQSYHGDSIGAMNVSGLTFFNRIFQGLRFPVKEFVSPNCFQCPVGKNRIDCKAECVDGIEQELIQNTELYAGIILEPLVFAASGMVFYDAKVLKRLEQLVHKHGILMIFDEVFTSMGRTGKAFAFQTASVKPDIVAMAKGLTGGILPLAATIVSEKVYEQFLDSDPYHSFFHAHTMTGNPVSCNAGLASIDILESENLANVKVLETKLNQFINQLKNNLPDKVINPRVLGGICAFELPMEIGNDEYLNPIGKRLKQELTKYGVLLRPLGNTVYLTPPYSISDSSLEQIFFALGKSLPIL